MRTALALATVLALGPAQAASGPRWATFAGVHVGGAQDDLLALNADCRPLADVGGFQGHYNPQRVADLAFGFSLPHFDHDSAAAAQALGNAALCQVDVIDGRMRGWIVTIDRMVVGATFYPNPRDTLTPSKDSVRALLVAAWGRPTAPAPTLDSWLGTRYRSYLITDRVAMPSGLKHYRVIIVDVSACSAFDRRVHRFSHRGTAQAC